MLIRNFILYLLALFTYTLNGQNVSSKLNLRDIVTVYVEGKDANLHVSQDTNLDSDIIHRVAIDTYLNLEAINYIHTFTNKQDLNFGLTYQNHWLRFPFQNKTNEAANFYLAFNSVMDDTLVYYKFVNRQLAEKIILGEQIPFTQRKIATRKPVIPIRLQGGEAAEFFIKSSGVGDPMNLDGSLMNEDAYRNWESTNTAISGFTYGIMLLIGLLNLSFYLITRERVYLYFSFQVLFSTLSLLYFEGYVHQFIFPNSAYWSRQTIAITMCFTFVFNNLFTDNILNFKQTSLRVHQFTIGLIYFTLFVLSFSFIHPLGFQFFIRFGILFASFVAILLMFGIFTIRKNKNLFYFFVSLATFSLVFFGTIFQLFLVGVLPNNILTQYSMHFAVVFQSIFLVLAVNDRFRQIKEDNDRYRIELMEAMNQYSQNLIANIEAERQRLASDIHDGIGQNLLVIRNRILLTLKKKTSTAKFEETLESLLDVTTSALEDARAMSHNLRPPILNTLGLTTSIESLVTQIRQSSSLQINLNMNASIDGLIKKDLEINVYRIFQEGFNNVIKHANATKINIKIEQIEHFLEINFEDNGIGFDAKTAQSGQGILGIKERVSLLKGTLLIDSEVQKGTKILIKIPV